MKTSTLGGLLAFGIAALPAVILRSAPPAINSAPSRTFDLTYSAEIHDLPVGAKQVDLWLPYPQSDDYQEVLTAKVNSAFPTKIETASQYGNKMVHLVVKNPTAATIPVTMEFTVRRKERVQRNFLAV